MRKNYKTAYDLGKTWISFNRGQYKAVMFDIDDTLLNLDGSPIPEIIKLLKDCYSFGFYVIIITARDISSTSYTAKQLHNAQIPYHRLHLRDPRSDFKTFKSNLKELYLKKFGIPFIMSVGDNWADVLGNYSGYCIKLPDSVDHRLWHLNPLDGRWESVE